MSREHDPIDPTRFNSAYDPARVILSKTDQDQVVANFSVKDGGWLWVQNWNGRSTYLPEHAVDAVWPCETEDVEVDDTTEMPTVVRLANEDDLLDAVAELPDDFTPERFETDDRDDVQEVTVRP